MLVLYYPPVSSSAGSYTDFISELSTLGYSSIALPCPDFYFYCTFFSGPALPCSDMYCLPLTCLALPCTALTCFLHPWLTQHYPSRPSNSLPCSHLFCAPLASPATPCSVLAYSFHSQLAQHYRDLSLLVLPTLGYPSTTLPCSDLHCLHLTSPAPQCLVRTCTANYLHVIAQHYPTLSWLVLPTLD